MLQWGRVLLDAETYELDSAAIERGRASMGPRPVRRGNGRNAGREHQRLFTASMGPRPVRRGNDYECQLYATGF